MKFIVVSPIKLLIPLFFQIFLLLNHPLCILSHPHTHTPMAQVERIRLNVGGNKFEVSQETLSTFPVHTLLSLYPHQYQQLFRIPSFPKCSTQLIQKNPNLMLMGSTSLTGTSTASFFSHPHSRNPVLFGAILDYYRTGEAYPPPGITPELWKKELTFFNLTPESSLDVSSEVPSLFSLFFSISLLFFFFLKEEDEEDNIFDSQPNSGKKFDYALSLLHKRERNPLKRGIAYLIELYEEMESFPEEETREGRKLECLYYISFGYYRLGLNYRAREYIEKLLCEDPEHRPALALHALIEDKGNSLAKIGFFFAGVATVAIIIGVRAYQMTKKNQA